MSPLEFIDPQLILTSLLLLLATFLLSASGKRKKSEKGYLIEWVLLAQRITSKSSLKEAVLHVRIVVTNTGSQNKMAGKWIRATL